MLSRTSARILLVTLALSACTDDEVLDLPPTDEITDDTPLPDGFGVATVRTPGGIRRMVYQDVAGRAIAEGDIDLGPVEHFESPRFRGAIEADLSRRWPNGVIPFRFAANVSLAQRAIIAAAHNELERLTPLRFVGAGNDTSIDHVEYEVIDWWPVTAASSAIGRQGNGRQTISLLGGIEIDRSVIMHETLHAAGFFHEQSRPDRDAFVDIDLSCVDANLRYNYDREDGALDLGLYDFESVMHYSTGSFCVEPQPSSCDVFADTDGDGDTERVMRDADGDGISNPVCRTVTRASTGMPIFPSGELSVEDVNSVWRMYPPRLDDGEAGDDFGRALAVGDFDGDGYRDVAVGIPNEDIDGKGNAGSVHVYRGTSNRLVPWQRIDQSDTPDFAIEAGDQFGATLFAADVDHDGIDDLLIGSPGENIGSVANAGAVVLMAGDPSGLRYRRTYTQGTIGLSSSETGDRFGASLAAYTLEPDTTVVHRTWEKVVAIGAPGKLNASGARAGAVFLVADRRLGGGVPRMHNRLSGTEDGGDFGEALAVGQLDDGPEDLVIGAPDRSLRGVIDVFAGRLGDPNVDPAGANTGMAVFRQRVFAPSTASEFGSAIAIGNVRGTATGGNEVVVGAPGTATSAGDVHVYEVTTATLGTNALAHRQTLHGGASEPGDRQGSVLAIGNFDPATAQSEIAIGVPGEDGGPGGVSVFRGNSGDATEMVFLRQTVFGSTQLLEDEDAFGSALAAGNVDGVGQYVSTDEFSDPTRLVDDLVIGAPGEGLDTPSMPTVPEGPLGAGAIGVMRGASGALRVGKLYYQFSATRD